MEERQWQLKRMMLYLLTGGHQIATRSPERSVYSKRRTGKIRKAAWKAMIQVGYFGEWRQRSPNKIVISLLSMKITMWKGQDGLDFLTLDRLSRGCGEYGSERTTQSLYPEGAYILVWGGGTSATDHYMCSVFYGNFCLRVRLDSFTNNLPLISISVLSLKIFLTSSHSAVLLLFL